MEPVSKMADDLLLSVADMGRTLREFADYLNVDLDYEIKIETGIDIERAEEAGQVKQTRDYR